MSEKVVIGNAVLYLGDCLEVVEQLGPVEHVFTDPPYEARMHTKDRMTKADGYGTVAEAHRFAAMDEVTRTEITRACVRLSSGWILIFCQTEGVHYWERAIDDNGGSYSFTGIWYKPTSKPNFSGDRPGLGHECIVGGWCGEGKSKWNGGGQAGLWTANPEHRSLGNTHTSIKPQKLMRELVAQFSNPDEVILDAFMGSGSTGVAAIGSGRKFIGIERDPEYFEICCRRVEEVYKSNSLFETYAKTKSRVTVDLTKLIEAPKQVNAPKPRGEKKQKVETKRKRFSTPTIINNTSAAKRVERIPYINPLAKYKVMLDEAGDDLLKFGPWAKPEEGVSKAVGMDVECFPNAFVVCFKHFASGRKVAFELSERSRLDADKIREILSWARVYTFNGMTYDMPMVSLALSGKDVRELKMASDQIISGRMKFWEVERTLGVSVPRSWDHVDLIEPNPAVKQGLKTLAGRLHAKTIMDLPFSPDAWLSPRDINVLTIYCFFDVDDTELLYNNLAGPLELRRVLSNQYGIDLRSKSDAQVGEAIVKIKVEKLTGRKIRKIDTIPSHANYRVPPFISFRTEQFKTLASRIESSEFSVDGYGKVQMPSWMKSLKVTLGATTYSMGIGGLHSTEGTRALHSDEERFLRDIDVSSQYPKIIYSLGMYPKAVGPEFRPVYGGIIDGRVESKKLLKILEKATEEYVKAQNESEGGKIQANGVFGKLLSLYSFLYAPDLGIATTLTGQLSLLMIAERVEQEGIPVVSANTDGLVFHCPRGKKETLNDIISSWEQEIGFEVENTYYRSLYNSSVNTYIGIKEGGGYKLKGPHGDPWSEGNLRDMMMKNPQMTVLTEAVIKYIEKNIPFEDTIRACTDPRKFITVTRSTGGAKWRGEMIGKSVRYYWSLDGDPFLSAEGGRKVAKTDGARPMMELVDTMPSDTDYERYAQEAEKLARELCVIEEKDLVS